MLLLVSIPHGIVKNRELYERGILLTNKDMNKSNKTIAPPDNITDEELSAWKYIYEMLVNSTKYLKTAADAELIRQYVQVKIMRDKAWEEWNKKPEKYIRIVTGVCADGVTPKVIVKENEHYAILKDCNKKIEKLLVELRLTPKSRLR